MTNNFKKRVAAYTAWRKGVLLLAPLEIALILVVAALVVITFIVSGTGTAGKKSIADLKTYLQDLLARMADPATLDPEAERAHMEVLLNKVKATCEQPVISGDAELEQWLSRVHPRLQAIDNLPLHNRVAWLQFKGVTNSFYELYFPAPVKEPLTPHLAISPA